MSISTKFVTATAALALVTQPCLAAAPAAERVQFDLGRTASAPRQQAGALATGAMASISLAASQETASEAQAEPRRRGIGTTTLLVVGGLVLLVVVLAAVAGAQPTAGPDEGAFD